MFDFHQSICDGHGEIDEERRGKYIEGLMDEFFASAEVQFVFDQFGDSEKPVRMMQFDTAMQALPSFLIRAPSNDVAFLLASSSRDKDDWLDSRRSYAKNK